MFIFSSEKNTSGENPANQELETVIGSGTAVNGRLVSASSLRIDGRIDGDIEAGGQVIVGTTGVVNGNITAANVEVRGTVTGNIVAGERLSVYSTGKLIGDVWVRAVTIAEDGVFHGRCSMEERLQVPAE